MMKRFSLVFVLVCISTVPLLRLSESEIERKCLKPLAPEVHVEDLTSRGDADDVWVSPEEYQRSGVNRLLQEEGRVLRGLGLCVYNYYTRFLLTMLSPAPEPVPGCNLRWEMITGYPGRNSIVESIMTSKGVDVPERGRIIKEQAFRTSFVPTLACAYDSSTIYVAGHPWRKGQINPNVLVIEKWTFTYPIGYPSLTWADHSSIPAGAAIPYTPPILGPTVFADLTIPNSNDVFTEEREQLYRGRELAGAELMIADPDNRYLLVVDGRGAIVKLTFDDSPGAVVPYSQSIIADSTQLPDLANPSACIMVQHQAAGRILIIAGGSVGGTQFVSHDPSSRTVLIDSDNDATFESYVQIPSGVWGEPSSGSNQSYSYLWDNTQYVDGFAYDSRRL